MKPFGLVPPPTPETRDLPEKITERPEMRISDLYASVATRMALMVCSRFSAWSNPMFAGELKTESVTSRPVVGPVCSVTDGIGLRLGMWAVLVPTAIAYVLWYGARVRRDPSKSFLPAEANAQTEVTDVPPACTRSSPAPGLWLEDPGCPILVTHFRHEKG